MTPKQKVIEAGVTKDQADRIVGLAELLAAVSPYTVDEVVDALIPILNAVREDR